MGPRSASRPRPTPLGPLRPGLRLRLWAGTRRAPPRVRPAEGRPAEAIAVRGGSWGPCLGPVGPELATVQAGADSSTQPRRKRSQPGANLKLPRDEDGSRDSCLSLPGELGISPLKSHGHVCSSPRAFPRVLPLGVGGLTCHPRPVDAVKPPTTRCLPHLGPSVNRWRRGRASFSKSRAGSGCASPHCHCLGLMRTEAHVGCEGHFLFLPNTTSEFFGNYVSVRSLVEILQPWLLCAPFYWSGLGGGAGISAPFRLFLGLGRIHLVTQASSRALSLEVQSQVQCRSQRGRDLAL